MKHKRLPPAILATTLLLLLTPLAAAASAPFLGTWEWGWNLGTGFVALVILGLVAILGGAGLVKSIPVLGQKIAASAVGVMLVGAVGAGIVNEDGFLDMSSPGPGAGPASIADATTGVSFDAGIYEATTDVSFQFADEADRSAVSPTVYLYKPGFTDKEILEGSARAELSKVASSGSATISGVDVQTLGCAFDVMADVSGYYEEIVRNVDLCVKKTPLGDNDKSVGTIYMTDIGTLSLSSTGTSLTCSSSSQCSYRVTLANSETDSSLWFPALKFSTGNTAASLDSVVAGSPCKIEEVSSTQYIVYTGEAELIGSIGLAACEVKITNNGVTGGTFNLTANDLWQYAGATAWNTNANVRGAAATSATEVSFA